MYNEIGLRKNMDGSYQICTNNMQAKSRYFAKVSKTLEKYPELITLETEPSFDSTIVK